MNNEIKVVGYPLFRDPKTQLKISLCMPILDPVPGFVREAVRSLDGNGYTNHELVMKDVRDKKRRVREMFDVKMQQNKGWLETNWLYLFAFDKGMFQALNQAMRAATGDVLCIMNSDDILLPKALEIVNNVFQGRQDEPFWMYGITVCGDADCNEIARDGAPTTYEQLLLRNRIGQPSVFWNRKMYEAVGEFDERYKHSGDYDYWLRCWQVRPPAFVDWPMGLFRRTPQQHSTVNAEGVNQESTEISNRHIATYRAANYEVK